MGGIGTPVTGDADAMEWNPAALGESNYSFQFLVTPISAKIFTDDWSIDSLYRILQDRCTPEQMDTLLEKLKDGNLRGYAELNGGTYLTLGGNGVGATVRGYASGAISADGAKVLFQGAEPGKTYNLTGTSAEGVAYSDVRIASVYSDPWLAKVLHIAGFHMGGTLRFIQGLQFMNAQVSGKTLEILKDGSIYKKVGDGTLHTWQSSSGWGGATDLGLLIRLTPAIAIDVSLVDVGRIWWRDVTEKVHEYQVDAASGNGDYVLADEHPTDMRPFWTLPVKVRSGLSVTAGQGVLWSLQYSQTLAGSQAGNTQWVLATQLNRIEALPLRLAATYSSTRQDLKFALGAGIRLGPLMLDVGTPNLTGLLNHGKDTSVSISTGLRF
jgi:hypothetical protein